MVRATVFRSNRSQAVRLPKDIALPDDVRQAAVLRDGKRRGHRAGGSLPCGMNFSTHPA